MTETDNGLDAGVRAPAGDEFLRFDYTTRDPIDLGAELGAEPARKATRVAVRNALIAAVLISAWRNPDAWLAYPRDKNWYACAKRYFGPLGSYAATMWAVATLAAASLIDHRKTRPGPNSKARSRLRASEKLLQEAPVTHVDQLQRVILEPLRLKDSNKVLCPYRESKQTRVRRADIVAQNDALRSLSLELHAPGWQVDQHGLLCHGDRTLNPIHNQLYRVFNLDWRHGGRWYGGFWQNLSGRHRRQILIDGQPVVEIDYSHLHPTLLAACCGKDLGAADPYIIDGFPRSDVKRAFNVLVNADGANVAVSALQFHYQDAGKKGPRSYALRLVATVKQRHEAFAEFWATGIGLRLQCIDGEMCAEVQRIMRDAGHPVLSVHDSFITEASQADRLQGAMEDVLSRAKRQLARGQLKIS